MAAAGIRGISPIRNSLENSSPAPAAALPEADCSHPITRYATQDITKGTIESFISFGIFLYISVWVTSATSRVLVDTGEHRSPKKAPDIAAPPARARLISIVWAMAIQMAPIVAAVPKEVPIRKDTRLFNKKVSSKNTEGVISCTQ